LHGACTIFTLYSLAPNHLHGVLAQPAAGLSSVNEGVRAMDKTTLGLIFAGIGAFGTLLYSLVYVIQTVHTWLSP
jgi:hypothetical protein